MPPSPFSPRVIVEWQKDFFRLLIEILKRYNSNYNTNKGEGDAFKSRMTSESD